MGETVRITGLALVLFGLWLLLSGHYQALLVSLGIASVLFVVLLAARMDVVDAEGVPIHLTPSAFRYGPWLAWQVIVSNLDVARRILDPRLPIDPVVGTVKASQRSALGRVVYANSITLTPGTVSMDIREDEIEVHALVPEGLDALRAGDMDRRVREMTEGKG